MRRPTDATNADDGERRGSAGAGAAPGTVVGTADAAMAGHQSLAARLRAKAQALRCRCGCEGGDAAAHRGRLLAQGEATRARRR